MQSMALYRIAQIATIDHRLVEWGYWESGKVFNGSVTKVYQCYIVSVAYEVADKSLKVVISLTGPFPRLRFCASQFRVWYRHHIMSPVYVSVIFYFYIRSLVGHVPNTAENLTRAFLTCKRCSEIQDTGTEWMGVIDWLFFRQGVYPAVKSSRVENAPCDVTREILLIIIHMHQFKIRQKLMNNSFSPSVIFYNKIPCPCHHDESYRTSQVSLSYQWNRTVPSLYEQVRSTCFLNHIVVKVTDTVTGHFHGNYCESPRRHWHCWQPGRRNDMAPIHTKLPTVLHQCTEDHVSRQLYNKDHLPLGWFFRGFSSRRLTTSGHSVARSLSLAFWFGLLESSRYSQFPTQSSDVTASLLHSLHYIRPCFVKKTPYQAF